MPESEVRVAMTMDERKQRILSAIVALYGLEGEPVGSGVLAHYLDTALSSATLRNEMAALTRLGLLEQPHTSAGRIPSAKGYRYYIDNNLVQSEAVSTQDEREIQAVLSRLDQEPDKFAQGAAKALSQMTGYTAAIATPRADDLCIAHFEVVQVGRFSAAVLAVTSAGGVRTRVARVDHGLTREDASALAAFLNQNLTFVAPQDLTRQRFMALCTHVRAQFVPVIRAAMAVLNDAATPHVFLGGEQILLQWQELRAYLPDLLATLNDTEAARRIITPESNHTHVLFGEDFNPTMPGLCVLSKRYLVGGGLTGAIALVGPARMNFPQLIPLLETFATELGRSMQGRTQEEL